jgi:release factor glutamine methyltransferase
MDLPHLLKSIESRLLPTAGVFALPEAERILEFRLNCSRSELYLDRGEEPVSPPLLQKIETIVSRRSRGEPLAYILGSAFFYHKEFIVTPEVLIPRPDTEILIEEVLERESAGHCRFLDIATGSGCIAATLAEHRPDWKAIATDLSFKALSIARRNCGPAVSLVCVNLLSAIKRKPRFDFVVSNPPYIKTEDLSDLQPSVRDFEPHVALDGGDDGLDFYRRLAETTPPLLLPGGRIYCEIGYDQGQAVPKVFGVCGWTNIEVKKDYGGNDRVVLAIKPGRRGTARHAPTGRAPTDSAPTVSRSAPTRPSSRPGSPVLPRHARFPKATARYYPAGMLYTTVFPFSPMPRHGR